MSIDMVAISLASAVERRKHITEQLNRLPVKSSIFEALTDAPSDLPYNRSKAMADKRRPLSKGEIGCFASHWSVLRDLCQSSNLDYRIVVEDDIFIDPGFWWKAIPDLMRTTDIHFLKLYSCGHPRNKVLCHFRDRTLIRFKLPPMGTQAYVVSKAGAMKFVAGAEDISRPIDDYLDSFWRTGIPVYAIHPSPILALCGDSTITEREPPKPTGAALALWRIKNRIDSYKRQFYNFRLKKSDKDLAKKLKASK